VCVFICACVCGCAFVCECARCSCISVSIYTQTHKHTCVRVCVCVCACMCMCVYVYVCVCANICIYACGVGLFFFNVSMCKHVHTRQDTSLVILLAHTPHTRASSCAHCTPPALSPSHIHTESQEVEQEHNALFDRVRTLLIE